MRHGTLPLKIAGFLFIIPGAMLFFLGIAMVATYSNAQELSAGIGIALFSFGLTVPGALFLLAAYSRAYEDEQLDLIVTALIANRRISIEMLAQKTGLKESRTRRLLLKGIAKHRLEGFFDRTSGEFVVEQSRSQELNIDKCPHCGAPIDRVFLSGDTVKCPSCNRLIK